MATVIGEGQTSFTIRFDKRMMNRVKAAAALAGETKAAFFVAAAERMLRDPGARLNGEAPDEPEGRGHYAIVLEGDRHKRYKAAAALQGLSLRVWFARAAERELQARGTPERSVAAGRRRARETPPGGRRR